MPGIYLHIPFCKQACHYCNFHFSTNLKLKDAMINAIIAEIALQKDYLNGKTVETIYFGGGTPSLLESKDLDKIFNQLHKYHKISDDVEVTLEANPDDLSPDYLKILKDSSINRLSIGIQSFSETDLLYMNRAHSAKEGERSIHMARDAGFENLTIDLIYGTPTTSDEQWQRNLALIYQLDIPHISCYCLTVEEGTALDHFVKTGRSKPVNEEQSARQFEQLMLAMEINLYEHYEISNFARDQKYSKHNTNYWRSEAYLGIGPAAHSFNGNTRQWNINNNVKYIEALEQGKLAFELEKLNPKTQYNEYVMTSLRTIWGCDLKVMQKWKDDYTVHFLKEIIPFIENNTVATNSKNYWLTQKGKLLADRIAMELFIG